MKLSRLLGRAPPDGAAQSLYRAVVEQARREEFYVGAGVPDTVDGRFDMVTLHAFLVLYRLKRDRGRTADLAQAMFDAMFADMRGNLREMGVGDVGMKRRIKAMVRAFYGRIAAYEEGLEGDDRTLGEALRRNLYRKTEPRPRDLVAMSGYMRRGAARLDAQDTAELLAGRITFEPPPGTTAGEKGP